MYAFGDAATICSIPFFVSLKGSKGMKEKKIPNVSSETKELPHESNLIKELPELIERSKAVPSIEREENCITLNERKIEIKPTKLKYFRNRTASVYNV